MTHQSSDRILLIKRAYRVRLSLLHVPGIPRRQTTRRPHVPRAILCPIVACADGLGGGLWMAALYSRRMERSYGFFIADVANLASASMGFVQCSYNGGYECDEGFYIGRLLLHFPRTVAHISRSPLLQPRA